MSDSNVIKLAQPGAFTDSLTEILRSGARALLTQAVEAEVAEFLAKHSDLKTETGQQRVVRHGHLPEHEIMTGIGVKRHAIGTSDRHRKGTPHRRWDRLVPVANRRVPRASRSALTSDGAARVGGACLPSGASRGGTQARCLKRQLSLPVSRISQ